jgi:uncharacterized membrane protein YkoI
MGPAHAESREIPGRLIAEGGKVSSEEIVARIRASYDGKPIGPVEGPFDTGEGTRVYGIRWLTSDGHVLFITVDAQTGSIVSVQGGE